VSWRKNIHRMFVPQHQQPKLQHEKLRFINSVTSCKSLGGNLNTQSQLGRIRRKPGTESTV